MCDDKILGADRAIVEKTLILIRDKYITASASNYFLEHRAGISGTTIGMANLRDVLSHVASMLGGPKGEALLDIDGQRAQMNNAEEHFRRAVYEPYEHAANAAVIKLNEDIIRYKAIVLRRGSEYVAQKSYFTEDDINRRKVSIDVLRDGARETKSINLWNVQWEEAVKKLMQVNEAIALFRTDLDKASNNVEADAGFKITQQSLVIGIVGIVLGGLIAWGISAWYAHHGG